MRDKATTGILVAGLCLVSALLVSCGNSNNGNIAGSPGTGGPPPPPPPASKQKVLYSFTGGTGGAYPLSSLVLGIGSVLYGTTSAGGTGSCNVNAMAGCGTVFQLTPSQHGWTETVLYSFQGGSDGSTPTAVLLDSAQNIYGITKGGGGAGCQGSGCGTIFKLAHSNGGWTESVIYSFQGGADGMAPVGLTLSGGNLFGTTGRGGSPGYGTVFELIPSVGGSWNLSVLYSFLGGTDGAFPVGNVIFDGQGRMYGVTQEGGVLCPQSGCGTVFELVPSGPGTWAETVIYRFAQGNSSDGLFPFAGLVLDAAGDLLGTTCNSNNSYGAVFELVPDGHGNWNESVLFTFNLVSGNGLEPTASLIVDSVGNLYGTTSEGGAATNGNGCFDGCGTVFRLTHTQTGWSQDQLYAFSGGSDGNVPWGSLVMDTSGNLYGMTTRGGTGGCTSQNGNGCGVIYQVVP